MITYRKVSVNEAENAEKVLKTGNLLEIVNFFSEK